MRSITAAEGSCVPRRLDKKIHDGDGVRCISPLNRLLHTTVQVLGVVLCHTSMISFEKVQLFF